MKVLAAALLTIAASISMQSNATNVQGNLNGAGNTTGANECYHHHMNQHGFPETSVYLGNKTFFFEKCTTKFSSVIADHHKTGMIGNVYRHEFTQHDMSDPDCVIDSPNHSEPDF